ncbi:DUF6314 family protein [Actinoplanes sp. NPDC051494]|uniref:DUF6314 family protein n=1 Tax=Actinoplanes sp. NPDC051494 TaxID=3363907 RepID=UPI0037BA6776
MAACDMGASVKGWAVVSGSYQADGPETVADLTPMRFLHGEWSVHREISDHRSGQSGVFAGKASFAWSGDELSYHEDGELSFGAHRGPASRRLIYRAASGYAVAVHFGDGRPFYVLDLSDRKWDADHLCGADLYTVRGRVSGPDSYTEQWHAGGPSKDYDLFTTYRRL